MAGSSPVSTTKNLRGLNKPKCSKCGNVARSRCPFQSCKSCCAKAQNPCPIHVLKQNGILPDKPAPSAISSFEPQVTDPPSSGSSWRLTALRQLSTAVINSLRARKALTRKDAVNINNWRFSKLREHIEGYIQEETDAFERYLHNVSFLEEVFSGSNPADMQNSALEEGMCKDKMQKLVESIKINLKSNPKRADANRMRLRNFVNEKLRELQEWGLSVINDDEEEDDYDDGEELNAAHRAVCLKRQKRQKRLNEFYMAERILETDNLIDKLAKARSKDDFMSSIEMKSQLFGHSENESFIEPSNDEHAENQSVSFFAPPKLCKVVQINQDVMISDIRSCQDLFASQLAQL